MFKKSLYAVLSLLVVFSMLAVASPAFALTVKPQVRGRVIAINNKTHVMTVLSLSGAKVRLKFNNLTRVLLHGVKVPVARMHVGDRTIIRYTPAVVKGAINGTASDVDDNPGTFDVHGTIAAVDTTLNTVSIASKDGGSTVVLNVDANTVITRDGTTATLADLAFGDRVEAKYNSTTMLASSINAESNVQNNEVEGTISAIDTTLNTITITSSDGSGSGDASKRDGTTSDVTVTVSPTTVIMLDDSPATLASLQVGFNVEAQYDPTSMLASFVEAESH